MLALPPRGALHFGWWCALALCWRPAPAKKEAERNNWAVLVETSRYWYNYRHAANVLSFYHTIKRLGIPDSQIILMMSEDYPCNPRNAQPGKVFNEMRHNLNLYGEDVEVDYRGDEVSVENFIRLLTGRHAPNTPRSKRLLTDSMSNIFIFITGHSGQEFIKFQDWEEITSNDIADAFAQMHKQRRYRKIFWVSDTCQAATLQNQFYSPEIIAMGSSGKKENSYSHHVDHELGIAVIDRFTYHALDFLNKLQTSSTWTVANFKQNFKPHELHANPELRADLFSESPAKTLLTEFLASTGRMRFQTAHLRLSGDLPGWGNNASSAKVGLQYDDATAQCRASGGGVTAQLPRAGKECRAEADSSIDKDTFWHRLAAAVPDLVDAQDQHRSSNMFTVNGPAQNSDLIRRLPAAVAWLAAFVAVACAAGMQL